MLLESPGLPINFWKQGPHVFAVFRHPLRFKLVQLGAFEQETLFKAELMREIAFSLESEYILCMLSNTSEMLLVLERLTVMALEVDFADKLSKMLTSHLMIKSWVSEPAGSWVDM